VLADAGFRVAAPDVRGYGGSDKPHAIDAYAIKELSGDIAGLIAALGVQQAVVIGHDWGAPIVYATALLHPARVGAVAGLSAPYAGRGPMPSVELYRKIYQDRFFHQLYFQEPGIADAEMQADVRTSPAQVLLLRQRRNAKKQTTGLQIRQDRDCSIAWSIPRRFRPG
jgi:pimeloyl-ACP methyl ester carboxylesterase